MNAVPPRSSTSCSASWLRYAFVGGDFLDPEFLRRLFHQRAELRTVARSLLQNSGARHDVRLHAASEMNLDPRMLLASDAVLFIEPADELAGGEAAAIDREARFDRVKRES